MKSKGEIRMESLIQKVYFSDSLVKKKSHDHDCHQIILISKGSVQFFVNNANYIAHAGSIIIFSRYENHSLTVLSQEYERYVLQLNPAVGSIESRVYSLLTNRPQGFCNAVDVSDQAEEVRHLFRRMIEEQNAPQKLSSDMLRLLVHSLLIMIYRRLPEPPHFDKMVYSIQKKFEEQCWERYTIGALAKEYNISASSLSHQFKKRTGSSVMDYLLSCRMAMARNELSKTNLSIGEIVEKCGFSDGSNFSRTFKKLYGLSPSAFRKKYKAE